MSGLTDESWPIKKRGMAWESLPKCHTVPEPTSDAT